jgi:hypothetical protein
MQVAAALPHQNIASTDTEDRGSGESNLLTDLSIMEGAAHDAVPLQLPG